MNGYRYMRGKYLAANPELQQSPWGCESMLFSFAMRVRHLLGVEVPSPSICSPAAGTDS